MWLAEPRPRRGAPRRGLHQARARRRRARTPSPPPSFRCTRCSTSRLHAASLLLNVLGEGTFLDLLRFVAPHAPDAATATAARLAHHDERRHVHFGIAHVRGTASPREPGERERLVQHGSVEARAAKLVEPRRA